MKDILIIIGILFIMFILIFMYCALIIASQYDRRYNEIYKDDRLCKRRGKKKQK